MASVTPARLTDEDLSRIDALIARMHAEADDWQARYATPAFDPGPEDRAQWAALQAEDAEADQVHDATLKLADELMMSPGDASAFAEQQADAYRAEVLGSRPASAAAYLIRQSPHTDADQYRAFGHV